MTKQQKPSYSGEFKEKVIEYKHSNKLSATETASHFRLGSASVVSNWERIYYEEGPEGLCVKRRGRRKSMKSKPKRKLDKKTEEDLIAKNNVLEWRINI